MDEPVSIVDPAELLTKDQILDEEIRLFDFCALDSMGLIKWLVKRHMLRNSLQCQNCKVPMALIKSNNSDGYLWKCKSCNSCVTIRNNSLFNESRLSLNQIIILIYGWAREYSQKNISHEAKIPKDDCDSVDEWYNLCGKICGQYLSQNPVFIGGFNDDGTSKIVDIGITDIYCPRYHYILMGGIERGSDECFIFDVSDVDLTQERLADIFKRYLLPGTTVVTRDWNIFDNVNKFNGGVYNHCVENYTQTVNVMLWRLNGRLRLNYSSDAYESCVNEFLWRNRKHDFEKLLTCFSELRPVL